MKKIQIRPLPGTAIAEDKDAAREIRETVLMPALEAGEGVIVDFRDVEIATQSFVHALISDAIHRFGNGAMQLITFRNCNEELQQLILTVVEYTLMAIETAENHRGPGAALT